ncbi:MAG: ParB/RepB/Spo0J family partition protein [Thermoguttaceae bacterium]
MNKERRLGRGLEALLGQMPARKEPLAEQPSLPAQLASLAAKSGPQPSQGPTQAPTPAAIPSNEAMFWLDGAHPAPVQNPHHAPVQQPGPGTMASTSDSETAQHNRVDDAQLGRVNVHQIDSNPAQPRQEFDPSELRSLAESISSHGLLQPVVVRRVRDRYQLVAGERRLRAAIQAGWADVPVNVVEADDRQTAELAIVENLQRKDLNALEKAASFQKYLDQYQCTQEELAGRLKLDRSTIANLIRLLELPDAVQNALRRGQISQGHARALLPLGDEREQIEFCQRIQREALNVRQTEAMVQETIDAIDREPLAMVKTPPKKSRSAGVKSEQIAALEQEFRTSLGMKVKLTHNARGRGKLVVLFRNHEEFERLKRQMCGG